MNSCSVNLQMIMQRPPHPILGGDHKLSTFQTDYKTFDRVKTIKRGKSVADVWVDPPRVRQMARGGRLSW